MRPEWSSESFREALRAIIRKRVPERDVEDVTQVVLLEVLASPLRPESSDEARKWIWGVARHKIADYHRHASRERDPLHDDSPDTRTVAVDDLLRWAVGELPEGADSTRTLDWLLREADGEKLEEIARAENLSPRLVRQRVSRLRRHFRARWAVFAALLALVLMVSLTWWKRRRRDVPRSPHEIVRMEPELVARANRLREAAREACRAELWDACVSQLDAARSLDPDGDRREWVVRARSDAAAGRSMPAAHIDAGTRDAVSSDGASTQTRVHAARARRPARIVNSDSESSGAPP